MQLSELIDDLKAGKPLVRSESLRQLASEVIKNQTARKDEDIDVWAQRIAENVCELTD